MAIIKKGNLLGASGKVDNLVVSHWKGITYVKSLPYTKKDIKVSEKQQRQRDTFGAANTFAKYYRYSLIRHVWAKAAHNMTGQNLFVSTNIAAFEKGSESIDFSRLKVSTGKIPLPKDMSVSIDDSILHIYWKDFLDYKISRKNDLAHVFLVTKSNYLPGLLYESCALRADGYVTIELHKDMIDDTLELYLYFSDSKEEHFSTSLWTEIDT